mmetsp:Transcript_21492/g.42667  ORF Transcript_21492/g.42667 Transcript_21492/m.42667 type:complete len:92 (-) Transcript_21492:266-541(-)
MSSPNERNHQNGKPASPSIDQKDAQPEHSHRRTTDTDRHSKQSCSDDLVHALSDTPCRDAICAQERETGRLKSCSLFLFSSNTVHGQTDRK